MSATDPNQRIYICNNCEQRELKRSLRRKDSKGKTFTAPIPTPDPSDPPRNDEEERQKVVVFNAPEIVDFKTGEVVLPTRVTCYCRHHKEKKGFWCVNPLDRTPGHRKADTNARLQHRLRCSRPPRSRHCSRYESGHHDHGRPQDEHEQSGSSRGRCRRCD